jgi:L-asparaginase
MTTTATVALIAAGGTIAMGARDAFDWVDYGDSGIVYDAAYLADRFRDVLPGIHLHPVAFRALGSVAIGWADWCELLELAERTLAVTPDITGIVITHGTATLEETAFFLHLSWRHPQPLVLVGAQRPLDTHGSDAVPNMRAAIAVAASAASRGTGALVVMNGQVFTAADVTKSANFALDAFWSPKGPVGRVDADGSIKLVRAISSPHRQYAPASVAPRVDMLVSYAGADGDAVTAAVSAGARGLVIMALPPGRVASGQRAALVAAAAQGVIVVLASRANRDGVPVQAYNVSDAILTAGDLAAHKARILLMLTLGEGLSSTEIQAALLEAN